MDFIPFLNELEVGGELIEALYLSILEKISRKVLLDNLNQFTNCINFSVLIRVLDRLAWLIELVIFIYPKGKGVERINSDVIVRDEEEAVFRDEGSIGFKELDTAVNFFLVSISLDQIE